MKPSEIKALTDEELARFCASSAMEENFFVAGCLGSLFVIPAAYICLTTMGSYIIARPWFWGPVAWLVGVVAIFWLEARYRSPFRQEFDRRSGEAGDALLAEINATLNAGEADWIVILTSNHLPIGHRVWLRMDVKKTPEPVVRADMRQSKRETSLTRKTARLPEALSRRVIELLDGLVPEALTDVPFQCYDGSPTRVMLFRREPSLNLSAHCNLCIFPDDEFSDHPTIVLCSELDSIGREAWKPPSDGQ